MHTTRLLRAVLTTGMVLSWPHYAAAQVPPAGGASKVPVPAIVPALAEAAKSPDYAKASAHDPQFRDKALWPMLGGNEYFLKEQWPKGRLLVWAHPGKSGGKRARGLDITSPANWLEDGKPCQKVVFDDNTDILLPASDTRYELNAREDNIPQVYRHITVERNATFGGGGDGIGRKIWGNVWIKDGAGIDAQGSTTFLGSRHTFFRNDNLKETGRGGRGSGIMTSQYFTFDKPKGGSVEFLGHVTVLDEFKLHATLVIVGRDSILQPGRNASPFIDQNGILALTDGAYFGSWTNNFSTPDVQVQGTIQGGLPDRPLTRNCTLGLGFKNHTNVQYNGPGMGAKQGRKAEFARVPSLVVQSGALRSYSTDIAKARLVIAYEGEIGLCNIRPPPGSEQERSTLQREPDAAQRFKWADALPRGIDCWLGRGVVIDGVEFDSVRKGGIMYQDAATKARWKNVFFGPNCMAKQPELFSMLAQLSRGGTY